MNIPVPVGFVKKFFAGTVKMLMEFLPESVSPYARPCFLLPIPDYFKQNAAGKFLLPPRPS
jgi:hypothetical protein